MDKSLSLIDITKLKLKQLFDSWPTKMTLGSAQTLPSALTSIEVVVRPVGSHTLVNFVSSGGEHPITYWPFTDLLKQLV